jgi:hypothetical protein
VVACVGRTPSTRSSGCPRWGPQFTHSIFHTCQYRFSLPLQNDPLLLGGTVLVWVPSIENYRPFKSASVVDMNEDNSEGLAWGLSATHAAKSTAVEMLLDDEEAEAEEVPSLFHCRLMLLRPLSWLVEMCNVTDVLLFCGGFFFRGGGCSRWSRFNGTWKNTADGRRYRATHKIGWNSPKAFIQNTCGVGCRTEVGTPSCKRFNAVACK